MKIGRRQFLLGSASVVAIAVIPVDTVVPTYVPRNDALQTVVDAVRRSLEAFQKERLVNKTPISAFEVPKLLRWFKAIDDNEALTALVQSHLTKVHEHLRKSEISLFSTIDPSRMSAISQVTHIGGLPWSYYEGSPEFFAALIELAPADLKHG